MHSPVLADLKEIAPYDDQDFPEVMARLLASPATEKVRNALFPKISSEQFAAGGKKIHGWYGLQRAFIAPAIEMILGKSSTGFTLSGLTEELKAHRHIYISNHRNILCDPALFTFGLHRAGWESPFICLGDNLLVSDWITDLVRMNRGVIVKRNLSPRELLRWSQALGQLISEAVAGERVGGQAPLTQTRASVWIAQREGRAKDGRDETHPGVLKMFALSRDEDLIDQIARLRLVPVAISYEFDPGDALKGRELFLKARDGVYKKQPGEDTASMLLELWGPKGRIHLDIGTDLSESLDQARKLPSRKEQLVFLAKELDREIQARYKLWPSNFIAADFQGDKLSYQHEYSSAEKEAFFARLETQLDSIGAVGDERVAVRQNMIATYAQPVLAKANWLPSVSPTP